MPSRLPVTLVAGLLLVIATLLPFSSAQAKEDVPFVVTPDHVTVAMLRIANVGPTDFVLDLGSGDGRIVIVAAKRFGARGLGVEIVPELVRQSRANARAAGVANKVEFREQDIFKTDMSQASVITMYLLPEVNLQLRPALLKLKPGTRIVSHDWDMGDWRPERTRTIPVPDKALGREKFSRVFLWTVPAQVGGTWCGTDGQRDLRLHIDQRFQDVEGYVLHAGKARSFTGSFQGATLSAARGAEGRLDLALEGGQLLLSRPRGVFKAYKGARFTRAVAGSCP